MATGIVKPDSGSSGMVGLRGKKGEGVRDIATGGSAMPAAVFAPLTPLPPGVSGEGDLSIGDEERCIPSSDGLRTAVLMRSRNGLGEGERRKRPRAFPKGPGCWCAAAVDER